MIMMSSNFRLSSKNICAAGVILSPALMAKQPVKQVPEQEVNRPNIIFILTDDQRWDALGYAGNNIIQTPEMDKLAREGVYFKNTFSTTPISAASRASILTGLYERTHDYTFEKPPLHADFIQISYPVQLKTAGYHTGFFGKLGVNCPKGSLLFDDYEFYDRNNAYKDRRGYFYKTINGDTVHLTQYTGHKAVEYIQNASSETSFCLSLSFSAPHAHDGAPEQYFWEPSSDRLYTQTVIPDPLLKEDVWFNALPKEVREGFNRVRWHWRFDTPERYQHYVKGYYRMISDVDTEIGKIRKALEEKGIADHTIIIFMGDNGYFTGDRQLADKWLMYDCSVRIPLIIYDPRIKEHYDVTDIALNIDIPKTILRLAQADIPDMYQGNDLTPCLKTGKDPKKRETVLLEHLWKKKEIPASEGVRTDKWKYFRYLYIDAPEELYDLENDPLETKNLAGNPVYKEILFSLKEECANLIHRYKHAK